MERFVFRLSIQVHTAKVGEILRQKTDDQELADRYNHLSTYYWLARQGEKSWTPGYTITCRYACPPHCCW